MPSGRSLPKPQTWRIENASAAAFMAMIGIDRRRRSCPMVTIARAAVRLSATVNSACRQSSGSTATTRPARIGGEHGEREFDGVGQLNRDHGIGRQAGFDEMRRQRRDRAVGLREGQTLRRLAGDALLVEGIDQRQRIRLPRQDAFEQRIERWRSGGLGHGVTSALSRGLHHLAIHFASGFCHQVSGR